MKVLRYGSIFVIILIGMFRCIWNIKIFWVAHVNEEIFRDNFM